MRPRARLHACPHLHTENLLTPRFARHAQVNSACRQVRQFGHRQIADPLHGELNIVSQANTNRTTNGVLDCSTLRTRALAASSIQAADGILHRCGVRAARGQRRLQPSPRNPTSRNGSTAAAAVSSGQLVQPPPLPGLKPCSGHHSPLFSFAVVYASRRRRSRSGYASAQLVAVRVLLRCLAHSFRERFVHSRPGVKNPSH